MTCCIGLTPRVVEGAPNALRILFLDPEQIEPQSIDERILSSLARYGEVAFLMHRSALACAEMIACRERSTLDMSSGCTPQVLLACGKPVHEVFKATLPVQFLTGQIRGYALSGHKPAGGFASFAHRWVSQCKTDRHFWEAAA